ncbi:MAG TPA: PTS sugar transporter subunit IIA [Halanaerobiales bacterium]|nr:PTS sugar transporter subunit IIA [Halanaerobiales bacterium]
MGFSDMFNKEKKEMLSKDLIKLDVKADSMEEAVEIAGRLLYENGYVEEEYLEAMQEREKDVSTYMGNGVAIPHGTNESKKYIKSTGISFVQIPEGVDFGEGNIAKLVIGIAGQGDEHLQILQNLATALQDEDKTSLLVRTEDKQVVLDSLL